MDDDPRRRIVLDAAGDSPPIMVVFPHRLRPEAMVEVRRQWTEAMEHRGTRRGVLILEDAMEAFQLINGRWEKLV